MFYFSIKEDKMVIDFNIVNAIVLIFQCNLF